MRVICIDNASAEELTEGDVYTVIGENPSGAGYYLEEVEPTGGYWGFRKYRFVPCSEIDETELVELKEAV